MGVFIQRIEVGTPQMDRFEPVDAVVDSGASYTTLAPSLLHRLQVTPVDRRSFVIANGETAEREVGFTWIRTEGRVGMTAVVFGDEGALSLLGAVTLQELMLGIDTVGERLTPVPGYLL